MLLITPVWRKKKRLSCGYDGGGQGGLVHLLHCLSHTVLDFMLIHQHAYQASTQHCLIVDPRVDLGKHAGAVTTCASEQLRLAAGVEADVGGYVVDLAGKDGPGVFALAAGHLAKLRGRDTEVWGRGRQASQVRCRGLGQAGPVHRGVAWCQVHLPRGLGGY